MNYEIAGFTFRFGLDENGNVVSITTPDIGIGPVMVLNSTVINYNLALTVAEAQSVVYGILAVLGLV